MTAPLFVALEALDGVGKTTLARLLLRPRQRLDHRRAHRVPPNRVLQQGIDQGGEFRLTLVPTRHIRMPDIILPAPVAEDTDRAPCDRDLPQIERATIPTGATPHHHQPTFRATQPGEPRQVPPLRQELRDRRAIGPGQHRHPMAAVRIGRGGGIIFRHNGPLVV